MDMRTPSFKAAGMQSRQGLCSALIRCRYESCTIGLFIKLGIPIKQRQTSML